MLHEEKFSFLLRLLMMPIYCLFFNYCSMEWSDDKKDASTDVSIDIIHEDECPSGLSNCEGFCTNLSSDHENCGSCGKRCQPLEVCNNGECLIECSPNKVNCFGSCLDGVNYNGRDLIISANATMSGVHANIGLFHLMPEAVLKVEKYRSDMSESSGWLMICAEEILVEGTIDAVGSGYDGGNSAMSGEGPFGGIGGVAGENRGSDCQLWNEDALAPGGDGGGGGAGGYAGPGINGDSSSNRVVFIGSGGGGGGPGGMGTTATCCDVNAMGGAGGIGGKGGSGGGSIMLMAKISITLNGKIYASGIAGDSGAPGGEGEFKSSLDPGEGCEPCNSCGDHRYAWCPGQGPCGSAQNDCCQRECCFYYKGGWGGSGGMGGGGAGGGILLYSSQIFVGDNCDIESLGGGGTSQNGGTLKIFSDGGPPFDCFFSSNSGRICFGQPKDSQCSDLR